MINYTTQKIKGLLSKDIAKNKPTLKVEFFIAKSGTTVSIMQKVSKTKSSLLPQYFTKFYAFVCPIGHSIYFVFIYNDKNIFDNSRVNNTFPGFPYFT